MDRQATVLVADDMMMSLVGKFNLTGVYTSDIIIQTDPWFLPQLVFLFSLETGIKDLFERIQLQVTLPNQQPTVMEVTPPAIYHMPEGHERFVLRQPFLIQHLILKPGPITAKVVHEKGEIEVTSLPRISLLAQNPILPAQNAVKS